MYQRAAVLYPLDGELCLRLREELAMRVLVASDRGQPPVARPPVMRPPVMLERT
jgi:hypothetical protein